MFCTLTKSFKSHLYFLFVYSDLSSFFTLTLQLNNALTSSDKNTVSKGASGSLWENQPSSFISPILPPFLPDSRLPFIPCLFFFLPPTNYHQDYRSSMGCDWVSLGVMWALRCLLNGEHHELWSNCSHSSTKAWITGTSCVTHTNTHRETAVSNTHEPQTHTSIIWHH